MRPEDRDPDDLDRPLDDLLTLRPPPDRETLLDRDDDFDLETRPEDFDDLDDRDTLPDERDDDRDDERDETLPDEREDLDDERDTFPDRVDDRDLPASYERDEPERLDEASPPPRADLPDDGDGVGYHSTPLRVRLEDLDVVRELRPELSEDLVVARDRDVDRVVLDRSSVRPPSLYRFLFTVAVLVLTRVALRVVFPFADRVVARVREVVPVDLPTELRPTSTPRSPSRLVDLVRSYPRVADRRPERVDV